MGAGKNLIWDRQFQILHNDPAMAVLLEDPLVLRHAMVISQGCDLVKRKFPWATVVPGYNALSVLNENQMSSARAGQTYHFVHLTADWCSGGFWVADLRMELPVDKSHLIAQTPLEGFSAPEDYANLAERLAAQRARPAIPDPCLAHVVGPMFKEVRSTRSRGVDVMAGVREIRVLSNDTAAPSEVTVFVLINPDAEPQFEAWQPIIDTVIVSAANHGIRLLGPEITTLRDMSALDYVLSAPVTDHSSS